MTARRVAVLLAGLWVGGGWAGGVWADEGVVPGDAAAGGRIAVQCRTCHGANGVAVIPVAPNIGGESASYLNRQLAAFRSGARENEMMSVVAQGLSDRQIADVAAYYAGFTATADAPAAQPAPPACVACHGANGIAVIPDAPNLAGETAMYLDTQLKAFRSGKRSSAVMEPVAAALDDAAIRALADYFSAARLVVR